MDMCNGACVVKLEMKHDCRSGLNIWLKIARDVKLWNAYPDTAYFLQPDEDFCNFCSSKLLSFFIIIL